MEDMSRTEYPAMLANLQPNQAVQALTDRIKRIARINVEIADWLQERRRIEEQYVAGLRKLLQLKVPNASSELGVFQTSWNKILQCTDSNAASHQLFSQRVDKDVETSLRNFHNKSEVQQVHTMASNLNLIAKEMADAQDKSDKLTRKGGKVNAQKVDAATTRLEKASQQWEAQAPFIFETLQALDEQRINHLRDTLTQLQTHELDRASLSRAAAEDSLNSLLEVQTAHEIENFANRTTAGKAKVERRPAATPRQSSTTAPSILAPPSMMGNDDKASLHSSSKDGQQGETKLRSRIGTMLGRRRQSIHAALGPLLDKKNLGPLTRNNRSTSPRPSSHNAADSHNRLTLLVEGPTTAETVGGIENAGPPHHGTNGLGGGVSQNVAPGASNILNGTAEEIFDGPHQAKSEPTKDAEGYTIPAATLDPISQAESEVAGSEQDHLFKLSIQKDPIEEDDQATTQAALSNMANTLTQMGMASKRSAAVRGRRDVRSTMYMPSQSVTGDAASSNALPPSPNLFSHESDTQSIRSGISASQVDAETHGHGYGTGLEASIVEKVSATFEQGAVKTARISGEIAFCFRPAANSAQPARETIRLNNFSNLEAIGPNRIFVSNTRNPDEFTLDTLRVTVTTPGFTYRVHAENETALASSCPVLVYPVWKRQGDKLGLVLQYTTNPATTLPRPVTLQNLTFVASYEGARASGVQTKPSGTHLKERHLVYWRLGDVTLSEGEAWTKVICRVVGEQHAEPQPGKVQASWEYRPPVQSAAVGSGLTVSRLAAGFRGKGKDKDETLSTTEDDDPFADEHQGQPSALTRPGTRWQNVPLVKRLVSGKYEAPCHD